MIDCALLTLIGVLAATEEFVVAELRQIDAMIAKFCSLEVEAISMSQNALHRRNLDLVGDWQVVHGVANLVILHHENSALGSVKIETTRLVHNGRLRDVAVAIRIKIVSGHGVALAISQAVSCFIAADSWIDSQRQ